MHGFVIENVYEVFDTMMVVVMTFCRDFAMPLTVRSDNHLNPPILYNALYNAYYTLDYINI